MRKIAVLNDVAEVAEILAAPLKGQSYEVMTAITSVDFERVINFGPELIVLGVHRRIAAFDRPIQNLEADVYGFKPLVDMEHYPAISIIPIILISTGLKESDLPTSLNYDSFLVIPEDTPLYYPKVIELMETVKTRRKLSAYVCPNCGSRMTYTVKPVRDLFCPRCHTAVVVIDEENCLIVDPGAHHSRPGSMAWLRPDQGSTSDQEEARARGHHRPEA